MTFSESTSPDVTESIPTPLSRALSVSQVWTQKGVKFDVAIAGIPFLMAETDQSPYIRETAQYQKQQIDTSRDAGEQTLDGYWIRSQTSWHMGAGTRFYEPTGDSESVDRYEDSLGINPWDKGNITLLHSMDNSVSVAAGQAAYVTGGVLNEQDYLWINKAGVIQRLNSSGGAVATYSGFIDFTTPVCLAGSKVLAGHATGIASASASAASFTELWSQVSNTAPVPYWVKSRIIATRDNELYELTLDGGDLDAQTPLFTHPDPSWVWTAVTQGPRGIYAAGRSNGIGAVYLFSLEDNSTGNIPKLGQAYQVVELPLGEEVYSAHVALGTYIGLGTSKGLRVGLVQDDGSVVTGPLLFNTANPVTAVCSGDRFLYGAVDRAHSDGFSGAVRVDLSEQVGSNSLRFPYAWDARPLVLDRPASIAMVGRTDQVALGIPGRGIYVQSATEYGDGYLTTGRVRFNTVIPKSFRLLTVNELTGQGSVVVSVLDGDAERTIRTLNNGAPGDQISLSSLRPQESIRIKLILSPSSDLLHSPQIESMQIRALPAPERQRLIKMPLLCMDYITASKVKTGTEGAALAQLQALEYAEETYAVVTVQDFSTGETYEASVEQVSFRRPGPKSADGRTNFGGYIDLVIRKL